MTSSKSISRLIATALVSTLLAACAGDGAAPVNPFDEDIPRRLQRLKAQETYDLARSSLESADYEGALRQYRALQIRFPFTDYATQAQLDTIYLNYKLFAPDAALSGADRFLKEHPRHPQVAYVQYLKGLVHYQRSGADDPRWFGLSDSAQYDQVYARRAFDAFNQLVQRYPDSKFVTDSRERMIYLRERMAYHDLQIAKYYQRRKAYVAASRRAEDILRKFQGTSIIPETLKVLENSYRKLELTELADDARALAIANFGKAGVEKPAKPGKPDDTPPEAAAG
ncbi:outer membrane protein assembly factor BamD [bacterium]|nr:outer membrane protein assembly factor BamD [bacterium]